MRGTKLVSTDGNFALYIPALGEEQLSAEQADANKKLFALMEGQIKHRPVMVSFDIDEGPREMFLKWMFVTYGTDLAGYRGVGDDMAAIYFLDREQRTTISLLTSGQDIPPKWEWKSW